MSSVIRIHPPDTHIHCQLEAVTPPARFTAALNQVLLPLTAVV